MGRAVGALLLLFGLIGPVQAASTSSADDQAAIRKVIAAQIKAFRQNDASAAFELAAPNIQSRFGDSKHFIAMVQAAYPAVFRARSFSFGTITPDRSFLVQKVTLVGPDGRPALALYTMQHETDGLWRIAGCALITGADQEI